VQHLRGRVGSDFPVVATRHLTDLFDVVGDTLGDADTRDGILRPAPLHAEEALLDVRVRAERVRGAFELDPPLIDDVKTVR